jgi:sigma-B regulation protein RsbU (phosphoserine phosphatase)
MEVREFQPKAFYRKLDSLLARIGKASPKDLNILVLEELTQSFGTDLRILSGCLYRRKGSNYERVRGPVGSPDGDWPSSFPRSNDAVVLLVEHKVYIYSESSAPPWGANSVAAVIGEENQYLMAFRLGQSWERELLDLAFNAIRNTLNYTRSTRQFGEVIQEASEIQKSLLPKHDPEFEGYDIAGRSIAAELVGGDLYDYHLYDSSMIGIAIGDASGHGLPAALLVRDVLTGLSMGVERELKISSLFAKLNRVIHKSSLSTRFVSLVYGELERNGTLVYVNAGHNPPFLVKESVVHSLTAGGTILGPLADTTFRRGFAFMDPGDVLILYTDGTVERDDPKGEPYGVDRLLEFVNQERHESASTMVERLFIQLYKFGANEKWRDDATVVIVKRNT